MFIFFTVQQIDDASLQSSRDHPGVWQGQAFENVEGSFNSPPVSPTQCLKIRQMFVPDRYPVDLFTLLESFTWTIFLFTGLLARRAWLMPSWRSAGRTSTSCISNWTGMPPSAVFTWRQPAKQMLEEPSKLSMDGGLMVISLRYLLFAVKVI